MPTTVNTSYTFYMDSDDGAQLYIDEKLLIDKGGAAICLLQPVWARAVACSTTFMGP